MSGPAADRDGILRRQAARESAARTYARWVDIVPVRGEGVWLEAADGRRYLDALSGAGSLALGHGHPEVQAAITGALAAGAPMQLLDIASPWRDAFTTALFGALPDGFLASDPRVQFCSPAGTDAVEAAIKLCQTATGRRGVLAFTGGYHGMTAGALAATGAVAPRAPLGGGGPPVTRLPFPTPSRPPLGVPDPDGLLAAAYIERLLDDPSGGVEPPALMLVEAVQGEGGVHPAPAPFLRELRRITAERGIPLVIDEVQSGVARTGRWWAHEHAGIVPDAIITSKAIGGGLPLAAVAYAGALDRWAPGAHTGTFRGTTLALAAGAAALGVIARDGLAAQAAARGERLQAALRAGAGARPAIGEVRGLGLMTGVELVNPAAEPDEHALRHADPALAARVRAACLRRGLLAELGGRDDTVLRLLPPLVISEAEVDELAAIVLAAVDDASEAA